MFTGLVEEIGILQNITPGKESLKLTINAKEILNDVKLGDSIAVNGVCLTVINFTSSEFIAQVMPETFNKTNLKNIKTGDKLNLERALRMGDRLGGHIVSGHVDGQGKIIDIKTKDIAKIYSIEVPKDILEYLIPKGPVAIDGTSLTIVDVKDNFFTISLIPHTMAMTTLGFRKIGSSINIEVDMLSKYVKRFMSNLNQNKKSDISMNLLIENGFI